MNETDQILKSECELEINAGLYDCKINNITIFNYLKRFYRRSKLNQLLNPNSDYGKLTKLSFWEHFKMLFCYNKNERKSFRQLIGLFFSKKKYDNFIFSFVRKDLVNGVFMDKFTDPLIDNSNIKQSYIIFERNFQGIHHTPRYHSESIIYDDILWKIAKIRAYFFALFFRIKHKKELKKINEKLDQYYPEIYHTKVFTSYFIHFNYLLTIFYKKIFKKLSVKRLIAPSRADFLQLIPAAKLNDIEVIELQHGITYGESMTYSGFRDFLFTPDRFLSFGKLTPSNVYGIGEDKIQEIGWAFAKFLKTLTPKEPSTNDVLVISSPTITSSIIKTISQLANDNPQVYFHLRPHPSERLSQEQELIIKNSPNILLNDNKQNFLVTLMSFQHVIGENSTALYEALSLGKKVGVLHMNGLVPRYLQEEDKRYFWEIHNDSTFKLFLSEHKDSKPSLSIYSKFDEGIVNNIIKQE